MVVVLRLRKVLASARSWFGMSRFSRMILFRSRLITRLLFVLTCLTRLLVSGWVLYIEIKFGGSRTLKMAGAVASNVMPYPDKSHIHVATFD